MSEPGTGSISIPPVILEQEFPVRYHELDNHGSVRPVTLLNWMQDAAGAHSRRMGISVADLRGLGLTWVISRIHLIVERYPRAGESVVVRTWPASREGVFTCREFELSDNRGKEVGRASTSWAVVDVATRRPVRLNERLPSYPLLPRRAVEDVFPTLPPLPEPATRELNFRVLRGDLDTNQHVNNAVFVGWALEAVPEEVAAGTLAELEIAYRAEVLYGETVVSRCALVESGANSCCLHQIVNQRDGKELARLRTRWCV